MTEIWKDIVGFENYYQVSNFGNIKSKQRGKREGKVLKGTLLKNGYVVVTLSVNGKHTQMLVHRLVATAFLPKNEFQIVVNHKDFNRANNSLDNLEWLTTSENVKYSYDNGRVDIKKINLITSKKVYQYSITGELINIFDSTKDAERKLGISNSNICQCCLGKLKTCGGYIWRRDVWK